MKTGLHTNVLLRTGLAILLLGAVFYNVFGYFVVFQVNRSIVRTEMRRQLSLARQKVLVLQIFDADHDLNFTRVEDREFKYRGELYDVLYESTRNRVTTFYCIRDTREEILMEGMRKAARAKNTQSLINNLITLAMPVTWDPDPKPAPGNIRFPSPLHRLVFRPTDPQLPPPKA